ncbi:metallophosphoesterase family protein [cyanobacterium endosymbiont of Epithemia clementina EcSB]|uniref:metallophosphoesterase family protein n=1 Tax=cyanobacterium endosymbiont of Epithemia clementina EcSB TaxID=3034674 RepID=UPI00247FE1A0|nr:metallophosphoesterase [cyanobacterium endosymbiont of Epithemia clementina EcSB]WGT68221.1 metallophosphoesterase [cyanobacterium endosymbiont of Epithemia clementina EcSB]
MDLNRRQFLIASGGLFGLRIAVSTHPGLRNENTNFQFPSIPIQKSKETSISYSVAFAPPELFAPVRGDTRIVVISDLNSQYGSTTYESQVKQAITLIPWWKPDLVLCGGDMIAGQKRSLTKTQIQAMWSAFDANISKPLRHFNIPFGVTIGNHDGSGAIYQGKYIFASERELASNYWNQLTHNPGLNFIDQVNFPFYYSFIQNDIFYLVLDASTHIISFEQLTWIKKSLASSIAQKARLRLVIGHLPLYPIALGRNNVGNFLSDGETLQLVLERYEVHTYISGHHHAYYPAKKGRLELLHSGALGAGPRKLLNSNIIPSKTLTVIDIELNSQTTTYTTYDMKTLKVIDIKTLPKFIGKVWRRDLMVNSNS